MLARSQKIQHPNGELLETPLLISSFSSKGFRFRARKKGNEISESFEFLKMTAEALTETVLISAYDLKHFYRVEELRKIKLFPKFIFVDSGGYETSEGFDTSEAYKYPVKIKDWTLEDYELILNKWPKYYPGIIVSYDHGVEKRISLDTQIKRARMLFDKYPQFLHDFLIKPERKGAFIDLNVVLQKIEELRSFHIIGLTEKELGDSIIERMSNIRKIREALDHQDIKAPIHIFGNLDPLTTNLYFISGAEIFDGLTWLRFAFHAGSPIYDQNMDAIKCCINQSDSFNKKMSLFQNVIYMGNLQSEMHTFVKNMKEGKPDIAYGSFKFYSEQVKNAATVLYSKTF